jgi:N-carbamoyl-L-amino-acid hydrolase
MTIDGLEVDVDSERVQRDLETLSSWSEAEPPAVTRVVFTEEDLAARAFVKRLCVEAGLVVREDPLGNTFALWEGLSPELPAVATGSHVDAIPGAGRYDGTVGVLGAIEAVRALKRSGLQPARSVELIMFTSEEPTRFGVGCLGSRAMSGALGPAALAALRDGSGRTLDEVRLAAGFTGQLEAARLPPGRYAAFVELHIEQGPLLERAGLPIGVVTAIAAPATLRVELVGEGGHAGTVLMPDRRDALCGAAEVILAVEAAARGTGSPDAVATTGVCRVDPGAVNGIPARSTLEIDIRDIDPEPRDRVVAEVRDAVAMIAARRGLRAEVGVLNLDPPARAGPAVLAAVESACNDLGLASLRMVSRAYHDALFMARLAPTGMIFIPCKGGVSHRPEEYSAPEDIGRGIAVLARAISRLASGMGDRFMIT